MKRLLIPAMFVFGMLVGVLATSIVYADTTSTIQAARAGLVEAVRHMAQLPQDRTGHLKQAIMSTQQAANALSDYAAAPKT